MSKRKSPKISRSARKLIEKIASGQRRNIQPRKVNPAPVVEVQLECDNEQ